MDVGAVVVACTGIVVSGVVGPTVASLATRTNERRKFTRETHRLHRDELRTLLDEAAVLLSVGPRLIRQSQAPTETTPDRDFLDWTHKVFPMRQRLVLRLAATDPVIVAYDDVRTTLVELASHSDQGTQVANFEAARDEFLDAARDKLKTPISEVGP